MLVRAWSGVRADACVPGVQGVAVMAHRVHGFMTGVLLSNMTKM